MIVGAGKVILDFYNNDDISEKRRMLESLQKDIRKKFNVSICEVADFDDPERCVLGLALAAGTEKGGRAAVEAILEYLNAHSPARVVVEDVEVSALD